MNRLSKTSRRHEPHCEGFGLKAFGGDASKNWLTLKNDDHAITLFQGMFERNTLTINLAGTATRAVLKTSPTFGNRSTS